jgi:DHA3 family macrolide efflux protein-like MFS transporter
MESGGVMSKQPSRLFNRNFFLLWQGQLVSQIGSQAFAIAMMFWIKHATGSATLMGMIMMVSMLPSVILGPLGGAFADRYSRRRIIILSDVINGIVVLTLAALMLLLPGSTATIIIWLFVVSVLVAIVGSFFRPAISASIPDLVPPDKVAAANSLNSFSVQFSTFLGQGTGGVLFRLLGAPILFLIDGVTYIFSAFSESFITIPQAKRPDTEEAMSIVKSFRHDIAEGLRYVWKRVGLRNLFLGATLLNFFSMPIILLLPFYVEDFLHATPDWYGFILAGFGVGAMIGYLFAGTAKLSGSARSWLMVTLLFVQTLALGGLGLISARLTALCVMFAIGIMNGIFNVNVTTILQITTPSGIRGRVFGLLSTLANGLSPIAMALSGVIADLVNQNVPVIYVTCGAITATLSIPLALNREFRDFLGFTSPEPNQLQGA